jgi:hypothetical protein
MFTYEEWLEETGMPMCEDAYWQYLDYVANMEVIEDKYEFDNDCEEG